MTAVFELLSEWLIMGKTVATTKNDTISRPERWVLGFSGPLIIGLFALPPLSLVFVIADATERSYATVLRTVADALAPAISHFFEATGLVTAVLLALAVATGFGQSSGALSERTRTVFLACLFLGVFTIIALAAGAVIVAVAEPSMWGETALMIAIGWLSLLLAHVVDGAADDVEQAKAARAIWKIKRKRARRYGIRRQGSGVESREWGMAEARLWCLPFAVWLATAMIIAAFAGPSGVLADLRFMGVMASLYAPGALLTLGWRGTADVTASRAARLALRGAIAVVGLLAGGAFGFALLAHPALRGIGVGYVAFLIALAVVLFVPPISRRSRTLDTIQNAATLHELNRSWERREAVKRLVAERKNAERATV